MEGERSRGRPINEVVRNAALQSFVTEALHSTEPLEQDVELRNEQNRLLRVRGTALKDADQEHMGALIVLNDVTRLRRLERVRRDFVANVSHELKTPITSIKGFVETLIDGAWKDPAEAERFLGIVGRQVDRLNAIIEDLLSLSRLEQEDEESRIALEDGPVRAALLSAIEVCSVKAAEKDLEVELHCDSDLRAAISAPLLEQAVVNLIDNAIKHSEPGGRIEVEGEQRPDGVVIRVRDQGCGIPREHLPRLFERFYRVDKARSRTLGGTGLGLAIVKHIAKVHGGTTSVESSIGKGSVFSIHLPAQGPGA